MKIHIELTSWRTEEHGRHVYKWQYKTCVTLLVSLLHVQNWTAIYKVGHMLPICVIGENSFKNYIGRAKRKGPLQGNHGGGAPWCIGRFKAFSFQSLNDIASYSLMSSLPPGTQASSTVHTCVLAQNRHTESKTQIPEEESHSDTRRSLKSEAKERSTTLLSPSLAPCRLNLQ